MGRLVASFSRICLFLCAASIALTARSAAQTYPAKPIVMISSSTPGSGVDIMAREIAKLAPKYLGTTMVVEGKPGAQGGNALSAVLEPPADGYISGEGAGKLATFFRQVASDPDFKDYVEKAGLVLYYNDRRAFTRIVAQQMGEIASDVKTGVEAK